MAFTFSQKIKTIFKLIFEPRILSSLLSLREFGYLKDIGWFAAFKNSMSIDSYGNSLPWFTYPSIEFLKSKLTKNFVVLEFGSGNSTLFFSYRVKKVVSIEHNKEWFNKINHIKPTNADIHLTLSESVEDYLNIKSMCTSKLDIIIVDGMHRNECIINSTRFLSEEGVVILDDSERIEYEAGKKYLLNNGFKQLDFWGISPGYLYLKCTTIFYQQKNCLEI